MDIKRVWGQILVSCVHLKIYYTRYWRAFLVGDVIGYLLGGTLWYLTGRFVGSVLYAGKKIPYALFIVVGTMAAFISQAMIRSFLISDRATRRVMIFVEHPLVFPIARILQIVPIALVQGIFWSLPICITESLPLHTPVFLYFLGSFSMLPALAGIGLLFTALSFYIRGKDFRRLYDLGLRVVRLLVPTSFAVSAFGATKNIVLLVPTVAAMEGIRMLVFGVPGGVPLIIYAFLSGLAFFIVWYRIFIYTLNIARRKGWIMLE